MRKHLIKAAFMFTFAYVMVFYADMALDDLPTVASGPGWKSLPMGPGPMAIGGPASPVVFWEDPDFWVKASAGSLIGYLIKWILDFLVQVARALFVRP